MAVKDSSSFLSPSMSNASNNTHNTSNGNHIRQTSLQYILNQDQNVISSLDYWDFQNDEGDDNDLNLNYSTDHDNDHCHDSCHPDAHLDSRDFQYSLPIQQYYSSHGNLVPPPPPTMGMDILKDEQILSPDEFNSIFESFTAVVEGHNRNSLLSYFNEEGCMTNINCSNGLLDDEQLTKALSAIAMI